MKGISTLKEFSSNENWISDLRLLFRNSLIKVLATGKDIKSSNNWIQFPYYHHVFDDERAGFEKQLKYLKNFGEFISMDDACMMIQSKESINGRFFSVSFDDGFYSTYSNMMSISAELNVPVIIYLPTKFIGLNCDKSEDLELIKKFYPEDPKMIPFLTWENCLEMLNYNVSFGSHTVSHANLANISAASLEFELKESKKEIEKKLNVECNHFACPWGRIGVDFYPEKTSSLAKKLGYVSFATTNRGIMENGDDLYQVNRQHLMANWDVHQLKYFFGS